MKFEDFTTSKKIGMNLTHARDRLLAEPAYRRQVRNRIGPPARPIHFMSTEGQRGPKALVA